MACSVCNNLRGAFVPDSPLADRRRFIDAIRDEIMSDGRPPLKLVAVRLVGSRIEVAVEDPPLPLAWVGPEAYLSEAEVAQWAGQGFGVNGNQPRPLCPCARDRL